MIIVYTGNGKGKTTAALGLALRAAGWGKRVLIIQFLKRQTTGEVKIIQGLHAIPGIGRTKIPGIDFGSLKIEQYGTKDFVDPKNLRPVDFKEAKKALESVKYSVLSIQYDLIILDEVNVAVKFGLIPKEKILKLLRQIPKDLTLVLTGRWAPQEFIDAADLVTEFKEIKHPFKKAIKAKKGIDY